MSNVELLSRITVDPEICHGKPCVRGLRYPVEFLLELLSSDMTSEQILADYPDMKFIVDAQLPRRLARELIAAGPDAVHTLNLPGGNRTHDREITSIAVAQ